MARLKTATRTLHNAGVRRVIGLFPSHKNQRMVPWESQIERDFFYDCEFRKDVVRYEAQPREFTYWLEGRSALYTPDAELILTDGTIAYCETKPQEKADAPELQAKWQANRHSLDEGRIRLLDGQGYRLAQGASSPEPSTAL